MVTLKPNFPIYTRKWVNTVKADPVATRYEAWALSARTLIVGSNPA